MDRRRDVYRILIADDHAIFRDGLKRLLEAEPDLKVVGEATNAESAVEQARKLRPDLLLLDVSMPQRSGLEALRSLRSLPVRTLLLTAEVASAQVAEARELGACGIVLKESTTQLLVRSIRAVMQGEEWVGNGAVSTRRGSRAGSPPPQGPPKDFGLTPRELEIASAIVDGYTNRDIAQKFSLSQQTVKHHLTNIFDKLGVSNRLELALFVVNHHLAGGE